MNRITYDYSPFIKRLKSSNVDILADALSELSGMHEAPPTGEVRELILCHLDNDDLEVKEWAIRAAGMHWEMSEAYEKLVNFANDIEQDEEIVEKSLASLNCYVTNDPSKKSQVSNLMANYIKDETRSLRSRVYIYDLFLNLNDEISLQDLANRNPGSIQNKIDYELLDRIRGVN